EAAVPDAPIGQTGKYKSGDRIVCTNAVNAKFITEGREYVAGIMGRNPGGVFVVADDGEESEYRADRFIAAPAHPAEGVPAQAVAVPDARAARQITDAIVENFKDAGWSMPSIDEARVLEAVSAAIVEHGASEPLTGVASDVDSMARVLMAAFAKAEPEHPITRYPTSFVATFADMARAAIAASQLAEGVPAQSYVVDFFKAKGFYPSPAQAFAAGVALAATQPAAQGMDAQFDWLSIDENAAFEKWWSALPVWCLSHKEAQWRAWQARAALVAAALAAQAKQGEPQKGAHVWQLDVDNEPDGVFYDPLIHKHRFEAGEIYATREQAQAAAQAKQGGA
ncbi:hypothetical protein N5C12_16240, partial [Comamonas aquatica]|uniref:hypothetical protein n=1 Tax=Comamonas aquatica TaxID=225991 RepID=UPI002447CB9E